MGVGGIRLEVVEEGLKGGEIKYGVWIIFKNFGKGVERYINN